MELPKDSQNFLPIEADLSPKLLKSSRKWKKQGNGDSILPPTV